jgi:hypothetical protein
MPQEKIIAEMEVADILVDRIAEYSVMVIVAVDVQKMDKTAQIIMEQHLVVHPVQVHMVVIRGLVAVDVIAAVMADVLDVRADVLADATMVVLDVRMAVEETIVVADAADAVVGVLVHVLVVIAHVPIRVLDVLVDVAVDALEVVV